MKLRLPSFSIFLISVDDTETALNAIKGKKLWTRPNDLSSMVYIQKTLTGILFAALNKTQLILLRAILRF